jgi:hypothetical protein
MIKQFPFKIACSIIFFIFFLFGPQCMANDCQTKFKSLILYKNWSNVKNKISEKKCPLHYKTLLWEALYHKSDGVTFDEFANFVEKNPSWPWMHKIKENAEYYVKEVSHQKALQWFSVNFPRTFQGSSAYINLLLSDGDIDLGKNKRLPILKKLWIEGNLDANDEHRIYKAISNHLSQSERSLRCHMHLDQKNQTAAKG